jgi:DNA-binding NtrC family response regulator/pSer/pThr/pTyr-binding forkhead associated (FHA) protein
MANDARDDKGLGGRAVKQTNDIVKEELNVNTPGHSPSGKPEASLGTMSLVDDKQATLIYEPPVIKEDAESQATLKVTTGSANKDTIQLGKDKVTIGRVGYNDILLNDKKVSRTHAAIYFEKGNYVIEDLNSTNGVFVDGHLVKKIVLKSGNQITLGDCVLLFTQSVPDISLEDKISFINQNELFNWLDPESKSLLGNSLAVRFFPNKTTIVQQNTPAESMYLLYSGSVRVVERNEEGGEKFIAKIEAGDFFGERALLAGEPGRYSMIADTDVNVLELRKAQLNDLLQKSPEVSKAFYRMVLKKFSTTEPEERDHRHDDLKHLVIATDVEIIGEDKKIKDAKKKIETYAKDNKTVLITGLSGTGKKTFARYFHKSSPSKDSPYVEISVAELDKTKVGAAIFGVESDPSATHMGGQIGYLEMIGTGTLAIGHIEQLDVHQQSKLVTYIKYGWFHRVYGRESVKAKTNVILMATGSEAEVMEKLLPELKELLEDRVIYLPPLLQRLKDIPILAEYYLNFFAKKDGKKISGLSREATEKLVSYTWPGNLRELENVIQRASIVTSENVIIPGDLIFVIPSEKEVHKLNILRTDKIRNILRHPLVPKIFVWANILVVIIMAGFTLYGGSRPADHPLQEFANNPGMLITWVVWFPILPISAFLLGRVWCGMCPIAGIGELCARVKSFNLPVPKFLKRMDFWMVIVAFIFLDYIEGLFGVAEKPWATGMLLVIIIGCSALFCVLFERKTFCRYVCPLAGMLGAYSTMSIVEVRGNKKICQTQCGQHLCYKGTDHCNGCPMFSYPASLTTNSECMLCLNCLKNCENRGVQLNLRPPLQEIWHQAQPLLSISMLGVMLVGLMGKHQIVNLTSFKIYAESLAWPETYIHTILYFSFILMAVIPFTLCSVMSAGASQEKLSENMARYGLAYIPLALSGHLAHLFHEILSDRIYDLLKYVIKVKDLLVAGVPIGSREIVLNPFIHSSVINFIKFMFISGGLFGSILAVIMIARRLSDRNVLARTLPHLLLLMFFWFVYLFIFMSPTGDPPAANAAAETTQTQAATTGGQASDTAAVAVTVPQQPVAGIPASIAFSLIQPDIRNVTSLNLDNANVAKWLKTAKPVPGGKQYRITVQGQITGAPAGSQVKASLEAGGLKQQFINVIDPKGNFTGDITLDSLFQRIPIVLQLIDPKSNSVLSTHRVVLF